MRRRTPFRRVMLATSALVPLGIGAALANPLGPNVVGGAATVSGIGTSNVTIHQTTPRAVINWNTFNIGAGETTRFVQPSSSSVALNRVTGGFGPSMIQGALTANGMVYLVNPEGVMISKSGVINTAGFLASTHDITNENFMAGRFQFNIPGRPGASIVNEGVINSHSHGFAALVAPGVRNSGTITATYGKVALASSGDGYALDLYGDKLISLAVNDSVGATVIDVATGKPLNSLVKNTGKLSANGGRVELTAAQARTVVDSVINNSGVIEARTVGTKNGKIVLGGSTTKVAGLPSQTVKVSGKLDVSAKGPKGKGGTVQVTGEKIVVQAASFDASGPAGGGKVLIGGDTGGGYGHWAVDQIPQAALEATAVPTATWVSVDSGTIINVSATSVGNGGKAIVWADDDTTFAGQILARGGAKAGDGGFVEVSGKLTLSYDGRVNAGATHGKAGTLLLDPQNARIYHTAGPGIITAAAIEAALLTNDVIVTTGATGNEPGDMFVDVPITWATRSILRLEAHRDIHVNAAVTNTYVGVNGPFDFNEIILLADKTGTGTGTVFFGPGGSVTTNGEAHLAFNATFANPAIKYANPIENFAPNVNAGMGFYQYMLVNSPSDLQAINNNLSANYVLGRNIDMTGVVFTQLGSFQGRFEGLGRVIEKLTINSGGIFAGMFSSIAAGAQVHELVLKDFVINSTGEGAAIVGTLAAVNAGELDGINIINTTINLGRNGTQVGGLVGLNAAGGMITDSRVTGAINIGDRGNVSAGGLVGTNEASIERSLALGNIVGNQAYTGWIGGLVGTNSTNGEIRDSYARGSITIVDGTYNYIGGLIGTNNGDVLRTYATGNINVTGYNFINNLIGINNYGTVTDSYFLSPGTGVGTPKTLAELQGPLNALNFGTPPWMQTTGYNDGLPHLDHELKPFDTSTIITPNFTIEPVIPNVVQAPPNLPPGPPPTPPDGNLIQLANFTPTPPGTTNPTPPRFTPQNTPGLNPQSVAPVLPQRPTCGIGGNCTSFASLLPTGQFIPNQVVVQIPQNISEQNVQEILAQMGLTVLGSQPLSNGNNALNLQLPPGVTMRDVILRLEQNQVVASAHANMKYTTMQHVPAAIAPFTESRGDPAQYTMGKLHLGEAHQVASGNNIIVAVIDSEVDLDHAEIKGTRTQKHDVTGDQPRAHSHGTAMAGAIVSRERLLGVAPGARILAIRAFSESQTTAESTTFTILKGIEHAISQGARVINMSFAGPYDPSLEKALKDATGKGVVLIGASGNAGPKSPPLWPGADPNVIAVTATDSGDKGFRGANRGPYISVAAPGVEILAPAPDAGYQLSTGTSIATAHVSGVVALMLERDPSLTPRDVRLILEATANDLGPRGRDAQFGWGLINPSRALAMVEERKRSKGTSQAPKPVQR